MPHEYSLDILSYNRDALDRNQALSFLNFNERGSETFCLNGFGSGLFRLLLPDEFGQFEEDFFNQKIRYPLDRVEQLIRNPEELEEYIAQTTSAQ